jgi:hypothetical protein
VATPDTRSSLVIVKNTPYRGTTRTFSNRYHFEGDTPPDNGTWTTFADAVVAAEKTIYDSTTSIIEAIGYDSATATPTNPHGDAVFSKTYAVAGTWSGASGAIWMPGDAAAFVRYATPARSKKNHPVYLSNYYHGVWGSPGNPDEVSGPQRIAIEAYAAEWIAGFSDGSETHERCGPRGAVALSYTVDLYVRHRDFPN